MSPLDTLWMALRAIARNKGRSSLTTLGVVIGVASVIAMVHIGQAATFSVTSQISAMGTNLLMIRAGQDRRGGGAGRKPKPFTHQTLQALEAGVGEEAIIAPEVNANQTVIYGNAYSAVQILGTTNAYLEARDWSLAAGRAFEEDEERSGAAVCLVGATLLEDLSLGEEALGAVLRVGSSSCLVIGTLSEKGESMGEDQDELLIMPLKAVQRRLKGSMDIDNFTLSVREGFEVAQTKNKVTRVLRKFRRLADDQEDDFHVRDMEELASTLETTTSALTALLGAIAAVSLLVGGIGIMNIMLVSVTERTKEIGVRLALGARGSDVLTQFLVESVALSCFGGGLGVGLGLGGSWLATQALGMTFVLSPGIIALGFGFSAAIGVLFGFFPARKAAHLNPIESLRHE